MSYVSQHEQAFHALEGARAHTHVAGQPTASSSEQGRLLRGPAVLLLPGTGGAIVLLCSRSAEAGAAASAQSVRLCLRPGPGASSASCRKNTQCRVLLAVLLAASVPTPRDGTSGSHAASCCSCAASPSSPGCGSAGADAGAAAAPGGGPAGHAGAGLQRLVVVLVA